MVFKHFLWLSGDMVNKKRPFSLSTCSFLYGKKAFCLFSLEVLLES